MAEISGFHNSRNGDRRVKADFFARFFGSLIGNGVFPNPSTGCQVIANNDMTVTVKTGKAWINGVFYENTADLELSLDVADGVLKRIDRVVLQFSTIDRTIAAKVKKGTFASSPAAPNLQRDADAYELGIADILVNNGIVSISQSNITDTRLNTGLCGIVHGAIDQVDTTTIFNQYQAWFGEFSGDAEAEFNTFLAQLENALSGDVAGNLLIKINENTADILKKLDRNDYVKSPGYATATGSANTYAVALNPEPTAYIDGMGVVVKINVQNTGASTINVNGLGAISVLDSKGNAMTSGKLKAGMPYTLRYNGTNFILQGEGVSGNATASDLLSGKTASTDAGEIVGTLELTGNATVGDVALNKTFYSTDAKSVQTGTGSKVKRFGTGSFTTDANGSSPTINSLDFTPKYIFLTLVGKYSTIGYVRNIYQGDFEYQTADSWKASDMGQIIKTNVNKENYNPDKFNYWSARSSFTITPNGFSVIYLIPNASYTWTAIE